MKISIIGAGNVGSLTAMRLLEEEAGKIILVDVAKGLARGKALDLEDARLALKRNYAVLGTEDISQINDSSVIVVTAGFARKPGMSREELLEKNSQILKEVCLNIKKLSPDAILIIVTNPLDLMTYLALKVTGFKPQRAFGMGVSLDSARFANLISNELNIPATDIDACVIGSHGEGMLPLARFTNIKGVKLDEFMDETRIESLIKRTVARGLEIVNLLGSGSAYFAPSAAIASIVKAIIKDEKRTVGASTYLEGQYGIKDVCLGVPCRLGKTGIEKIVELKLTSEEGERLKKSASLLKEQYKKLII